MRQTADIVIVGAGPGGLSAAAAAAQCGARVTILDAYPVPGGQYYHQPPVRFLPKATARQLAGRALWQRAVKAGVEIISNTLVWNLSNQRFLSLHGPAGIDSMKADGIILATGAYERTAAFPGWTLPGVITAGAAQVMLFHRIKPGLRILAAGTGPLQLVTAANLVEAHLQVVGILEAAKIFPSLRGAMALYGQWGRINEGMRSMSRLLRQNVPYRMGWGIVAAHGIEQVEGATIARLDAQWRPVPGSEREVACDTICTGYGFIPFNTLAKLAGTKQIWQPELGGEVPFRDETMQTSVEGIYAVGDGAGIGGYKMAMVEGVIAGASAAAALGIGISSANAAIQRVQHALDRERRFQRYYASLFTPLPGLYELADADTVICRCESVNMEKVKNAILSGVNTLQEMKAVTRCGMGDCQGRVCGTQIAHMISQRTGKSLGEIGTYSARPPLFPLPVGAFLESEK